jgi:hypothetical protein
MTGKKQKVACGKKNVLVTTNYREITCGLCKRTVAHKATQLTTSQKDFAKYYKPC